MSRTAASPAQRLARAIERVEETSANLQRAASSYVASADGSWERSSTTRNLTESARQYANAVRALSRTPRSNA